MGRTAKLIQGGLLSGVGEGLLEAARAMRQKALLRLRDEGALEREELRNTSAMDRETFRAGAANERSEADFERRKGLLSSVLPSADGNVKGITAGGDTIDLGFKSGKKSDQAASSSGLSVEDKRELDLAIERHTSGKGSLEGEKTDWNGAANRLIKNGRPDLAARLRDLEPTGSKGVDVASPEYAEAQRLAEEWASDQAKYLRTDKADFADYGGNRTAAIEAKTREFYGQLTGAAATNRGSAATAAPATGGPPGSGTQADPYQATTQADIDWFRDSAPAGSVIRVNGELFTK